MGITAALAFASRRLGLESEPSVAESPIEDTSGQDELLTELRYVREFAPKERIPALLGLLERFPFDAALAAALVELAWLDGRPLEQGLVAWDLLNNLLFGKEHAALVATLRARLVPLGDLRPAPNRATIKSSPKALRKRVLADVEKRTGEGLKGVKRRAAKRQVRSQEDLELLWLSFEQELDVEALILLHHVGSATRQAPRFAESEVRLLEYAERVIDAGLSSYGSYLLALASGLPAGRKAAMRLVELYLERSQTKEARARFDEISWDEPASRAPAVVGPTKPAPKSAPASRDDDDDLSSEDDEFDDDDDDLGFEDSIDDTSERIRLMLAVDDDRVGLGARLLIAEQRYEEAEQMLSFVLDVDFDDPEGFAKSHPRVVCAAVELAMIQQRFELPILDGLSVAVDEAHDWRYATRLDAGMEFAITLEEEGATEALGVLVDSLLSDPANIELWHLFVTLAGDAGLKPDAVSDAVSEFLQTFPQSVIVWSVVRLTKVGTGPRWLPLDAAISQQFSLQTAP